MHESPKPMRFKIEDLKNDSPLVPFRIVLLLVFSALFVKAFLDEGQNKDTTKYISN